MAVREGGREINNKVEKDKIWTTKTQCWSLSGR